MARQYLSHPFTVPMKVLASIMLAAMPVALLANQAQLNVRAVVPLVLVGAFFMFSWIQTVVFIEGDELVAKRLWKEVRLLPHDIEDIDFFGITKLLKLSFRRNTELGRAVVFGARTKLRPGAESTAFDAVPTFERLGRFCGWKN